MTTEFKLPALAENVDTATLTKVLVSVGDHIEQDQPILEIETEKAAAEVPSTVSGKVTEIRVQEGATIKVGDVVLVVEEAGQDAEAPSPAPAAEPPAGTTVDSEAEPPIEPPEKPKAQAAGSTESAVPPAIQNTTETEALAGEKEQDEGVVLAGHPVGATPAVRRLARELGVDVNEVTGTGPQGRITAVDVKEHARKINSGAAKAAARSEAAPARELPDFTRWGEIERRDMTGVRRSTAQNLTQSWTTIPHVTQFDKADVTELERVRKQYAEKVESHGGKLTVTAVLLKILAAALKRFPQFSTSIDMENKQVIYKKYCHIGVAVDTGRGLLVPVVRDVDKKSLAELSAELAQLAERARNGKTTLEEMQGGTFTLSNLGGIGGTAFTPLINPPEVAILGVSRARLEPVYLDGAFAPKLMVPLSLSYDHRAIDGADGARFLRWICEAIEQPLLLFLEG